MRAQSRWLLGLLVMMIVVGGFVAVGGTAQPETMTLYLPWAARNDPATFYVSRRGNNGDGNSWATAWNELSQINWQRVRPGDTVLLDGGENEMVYLTPLVIGKSGNPYQPIRIALAQEQGRSGKVILFGGRSTPLPYSGQDSYQNVTTGVREAGIEIGERSWITIDGGKWGGIAIYGHATCGIRFGRQAHDIVVRNTEIWDNGWAYHEGDGWHPDGPGIDLAGSSIDLERLIIHDNGQDAIQSGGPLAGIALRRCWLYNLRRNPENGEPFNGEEHSDGLQIYDGGRQAGILIEECVIGPGFLQGLILGQSPTGLGQQATIDDVTIRHALFIKASSTNIMGYPETFPRGWVIDHVTAHTIEPSASNVFLEGGGLTILDSILAGGALYLPDGVATQTGNCRWLTRGFNLGMRANPLFVAVSNDWFSLDDYRLAAGSPCTGKGAHITSVAQLLAQPDTAP